MFSAAGLTALPCGFDVGVWGEGGIGFRNTAGLFIPLSSTDYEVLDPGPATFHIVYHFGNTLGFGFFCCDGDIDVHFYE